MAKPKKSAPSKRQPFSRIFLHMAAFTYYRLFERNTLDAVIKIINDKDDGDQLKKRVAQFLKYKSLESSYVQVAGAVLFASVISCLSWNQIENGHWSIFALFYSSIVFALVAIVTGAQQIMVLPDSKDLTHAEAVAIKSDMTKKTARRTTEARPSYRLLFALQVPLMLFALAAITFLAGLWSVVFSHLAANPYWGDAAKIATFFGVVNLVALSTLFICSAFIYRMPELDATKVEPVAISPSTP